MQFKIKDIKITISFTFFALVLLLVVFRKNDFLYLTCFFAILHELGHIVALRIFGVKIINLKISFLGANIKTENFKKVNPIEEIKILSAGPFVNLILFLVFLIFSRFTRNDFLNYIYSINFCLFVFNILPFYNFDGGKILEVLLKSKLNEKDADILITCVSLVILIPVTIFSINVFLSDNHNFYYIIVSGLMLLTIILKK